MPRVTIQDVRDIAELSDLSDSKVNSFISDANAIVNQRVQGSIHNNLLPIVEKWLAAHLATLNPQELPRSAEGVGQLEIRFQGESALGLESTRYGQQVLELVPKNVITSSTGAHYVRNEHSTTDMEALDDDDDNWGEFHDA